MTEAGNTGVAGGTEHADPVPEENTAPDGSTVLPPEPQPEPEGDEQNSGYAQGDEQGVDDATAEKAEG